MILYVLYGNPAHTITNAISPFSMVTAVLLSATPMATVTMMAMLLPQPKLSAQRALLLHH